MTKVSYCENNQQLLEMGKEIDCLLAEVVHHLVVAARCVYPGDEPGLQLVHQLAQDNPIPKHVFIRYSWREALPHNGLNPCLGFRFLFRLSLSCNLRTKHEQTNEATYVWRNIEARCESLLPWKSSKY